MCRELAGPVGVSAGQACPARPVVARSARFHNRTVWSPLALPRVCPSGLNATEATVLVWLVSG